MFCNDLLSLDPQTIEDLHIKVNPVTNLPEVNCFSEHLHTFLQVRQLNSKNLILKRTFIGGYQVVIH